MKQFPKRLIKALRLLRRPLYRRGLFLGIAGAIEHTAALRGLDVRTVIDVGANKGQFSLLARELFPEARIEAFEPLAEPAQLFRKVFSGDTNVVLHGCALGPESSKQDIHISGQSDSSSLLAILPRQEDLYPGTKSVGTRTVDVRRGDEVLDTSVLEKPILIKLDVQGFEKSALEGMPQLLSQADYVYAEVAYQEMYAGQVLAAELFDFLHERGFQLKGIYNLSKDESGQPVYADALFVRE